MAPDQRYCLVCGERRTGGGLRDSLPRAQTAAPAAAAPAPRPWLSPSSSLIAGVATLLIALGVGVLIGRSGDHGSTNRAAATPQVVTVSTGAPAAGAGAAGTSTTATASTSSKSASKHKSKSSSSKSKVSGSSDVQATAKKNGVKLPPKVVKIGQKCAAGAKGCQGGKFTGNFFGGG